MRCFEDVLHQTGWGTYHKFVLFFFAICAFCSSAAVTSIPFALPAAQCDLKLSDNEVLWINAILSLGVATGSLSSGLLSDILNRQIILPISLVLIFLSCFANGFAGEFIMFIGFTFILGVGASTNFIYIKVNLSEILPMKHRGFYLVTLDIFYLMGFLISSSIGWVIKPQAIIDDENYNSWRKVFGFSSAISLFGICLCGVLQPSPRILLATNKKTEAYLVLKYMFSISYSNHSDNYKIQPLEIENLIENIEIYREYASNCKDQCLLASFKFYKLSKRLLKWKIFKIIIATAIIKSSLFMGYTATNIGLTKSLYMNTTDSDCQFSSLEFLHLSDRKSMLLNCDNFISAYVFRDYILIGSSALMALIFISLLVDKIGRRLPLAVALIICGLISINLIFINSYMLRLPFSALYMMGFAVANAVSDIIIIENLPTCIRSTGFSATIFPANILSFISRLLIDTDCKISLYIIGACNIAVGILSCFLMPELKRRPMVE